MANKRFNVSTYNLYNLVLPGVSSTYVSVLNDHLIDETLSDEKLPVWQSDHGQVVVTIRPR